MSRELRPRRRTATKQTVQKPARVQGLASVSLSEAVRPSSGAISGIANGFPSYRVQIVAGILLFAAFVWGYWPSLLGLVSEWNRIPDYSHGFLVAPIAIYFLVLRRSECPKAGRCATITGLSLLAIAGLMRIVAARYYLEAVDGWSIPFWIAGSVSLLWGHSILKWALPSIIFLFFMIPLPYRLESILAAPMQRVSTQISTFALQSLMIPATSEGNTIIVGSEKLEVARACSGLRILVGMSALAFAVLVLFPRPWVTKLMLVLAILPVSLLSNSIRILATGLLYQAGWGDAAKRLSHDLAGWFMIPLAALLFALILWYLDRLFTETTAIDSARLIRHQTLS